MRASTWKERDQSMRVLNAEWSDFLGTDAVYQMRSLVGHEYAAEQGKMRRNDRCEGQRKNRRLGIM